VQTERRQSAGRPESRTEKKYKADLVDQRDPGVSNVLPAIGFGSLGDLQPFVP
jgi:hypothetical protein